MASGQMDAGSNFRFGVKKMSVVWGCVSCLVCLEDLALVVWEWGPNGRLV